MLESAKNTKTKNMVTFHRAQYFHKNIKSRKMQQNEWKKAHFLENITQ